MAVDLELLCQKEVRVWIKRALKLKYSNIQADVTVPMAKLILLLETVHNQAVIIPRSDEYNIRSCLGGFSFIRLDYQGCCGKTTM